MSDVPELALDHGADPRHLVHPAHHTQYHPACRNHFLLLQGRQVGLYVHICMFIIYVVQGFNKCPFLSGLFSSDCYKILGHQHSSNLMDRATALTWIIRNTNKELMNAFLKTILSQKIILMLDNNIINVSFIYYWNWDLKTSTK